MILLKVLVATNHIIYDAGRDQFMIFVRHMGDITMRRVDPSAVRYANCNTMSELVSALDEFVSSRSVADTEDKFQDYMRTFLQNDQVLQVEMYSVTKQHSQTRIVGQEFAIDFLSGVDAYEWYAYHSSLKYQQEYAES